MPGDGDEPFAASVTPDTQGAGPDVKPVRRFTWRELSQLNEPHNAHVAVRGKVRNSKFYLLNFDRIRSWSMVPAPSQNEFTPLGYYIKSDPLLV